jgi:hypothetical protein
VFSNTTQQAYMGLAPHDTTVTPISGHAAKLHADTHIKLNCTLGILSFTSHQEIHPGPYCNTFTMRRELLMTSDYQTPMQPMERDHWHLALAIVCLVSSLLALVLFLPLYVLFSRVSHFNTSLNLHSLCYRIVTRNYRLSDPEVPDDHNSSITAYSSSSAHSESREIEYIDSMIPPTVYDATTSEARWKHLLNQPAW